MWDHKIFNGILLNIEFCRIFFFWLRLSDSGTYSFPCIGSVIDKKSHHSKDSVHYLISADVCARKHFSRAVCKYSVIIKQPFTALKQTQVQMWISVLYFLKYSVVLEFQVCSEMLWLCKKIKIRWHLKPFLLDKSLELKEAEKKHFFLYINREYGRLWNYRAMIQEKYL